ncbi:MAG: murein biosynthesis integral membrane protein MurJ, partial [Fusobacteriaceae bacterium]
ISLSGMISAVLNNFKQFLIPASTGIFFNFAVIISTVIAGETHGVMVLGYGVVFAGLLQFLVVLPSFFKIVKGYSFKIDFKDEYLKKIAFMILPMLVGIVARQFNTVVDQYFASYLPSGGVSALENATRIYNLPIGVFGISLSTVIFPIMAHAISNNRKDVLQENFMKGLTILLFLVIPSMGVFTFYSADIIKLTLSYGKFDMVAAKVTSEALFYYSLGLYFYTAIHLVTRGFYGMKDSKEPVKYSVLSIVVNVFLNWLLIDKFQYKGLALATAVAAGVNFICLLLVYDKKYVKLKWKKYFVFAGKTILTTAVAIVLSYKIDNIILKLSVFSLVYLLLWSHEMVKKKMEMFYEKE